jgi:hypothetical protein
MGMQQTIQHKYTPDLSIENSQDDNRRPLVRQTLHNDLKIPFVHEEIAVHSNKYKLGTMGHSNQLISEVSMRRRKKITKNMTRRPSLGSSTEQSMDGT